MAQKSRTNEPLGTLIVYTRVTSTNGTSTQSCHLSSSLLPGSTVRLQAPNHLEHPVIGVEQIGGGILRGLEGDDKTAEILRRHRVGKRIVK